MNDEDKKGKKYKEFMARYRFCSKEEEEELKFRFNKSVKQSAGSPRNSVMPLAVENDAEKY